MEIKQIAEALLNILQYLHQRQPAIIHRDLKPSNILLTDRTGNSVGQVYLIDFGAVKNVAATEGGTITVVGTYGYMPPEQFGGKVTAASDLYSLGATLIYLATGKHPTELPSKDGKIVFEESVNLKPSLRRWLTKMIEPSCDNRFGSVRQALQALDQPIKLSKNTRKSEIVQQPADSKIRLRKTLEDIDIFIPPQGFTPELIFIIVFALGWNSFLVVWTGAAVFMPPFPINLFFGLFSIPFWTVGLSLIGAILFTLFGSIRLTISSEQISLTYKCFKLKYQKPKPTARYNITAIERTVLSYEGQAKNNDASITVWADTKPYRIKSNSNNNESNQYSYLPNLSVTELDWLAQELSEWLDMSLAKTET